MGNITGFKINDERAFRILTRSGTSYEISAPDDAGYRQIRRAPGSDDKGKTFIEMHSDLEHGLRSIREISRTEFIGRLKTPASLGTSLYFEIKDEDRNIVSEPVEDIEETSPEDDSSD